MSRRSARLQNGKILTGFAGSTADAFTLIERFEEKLGTYGGNMKRAAIELAKDWRMDRILRRLEAMLIVADQQDILMISGNGDVIEPDNQHRGNRIRQYVCTICGHCPEKTCPGSFSKGYRLESLQIAADICIYTNNNI
jgi:ATP-dependent HslUV protease, peptidase subunit HslV